MPDFDIDKCHRDGICTAVCPMNIIEQLKDSPLPTMVAELEHLCIRCGHCVAACPHGAVSLPEMSAEQCPPLKESLRPGIDQVEQLFRSRRSIRCYLEKEIEGSKIASLIEHAGYAPTGRNSQQIKWLVYNSREQVKIMAGMVIDMIRELVAREHPMVRLYRLERFVAAWEAGIDHVLRGAPGLIITHAPKVNPMAQVDCSIALTYLDLAAPSYGLGSCWAGFFMMAAGQWQPLKDYLALPAGHACLGAMMIGYPKYRYHRLPLRNEADISWRG